VSIFDCIGAGDRMCWSKSERVASGPTAPWESNRWSRQYHFATDFGLAAAKASPPIPTFCVKVIEQPRTDSLSCFGDQSSSPKTGTKPSSNPLGAADAIRVVDLLLVVRVPETTPWWDIGAIWTTTPELPPLVGISIRETMVLSNANALPEGAVGLDSITLLFESEDEGVIAVTEVLLIRVELIERESTKMDLPPLLSVASSLIVIGPVIAVKLADGVGAVGSPVLLIEEPFGAVSIVDAIG
jgi:hypothetical protein